MDVNLEELKLDNIAVLRSHANNNSGQAPLLLDSLPTDHDLQASQGFI